ncbi:MAG: TIM-barrel domain-containing protein [Anaerolineales bacterium]
MAKSFWQLVVTWLGSRIRYPDMENRVMALSEPNVRVGLTDHPLDRNGAPIFNIFSYFPRLRARKPYGILSVELRDAQDNRVTFEAQAYNLFKGVDANEYHVEYTREGDPLRLTLQLDFLTPHVYRVRLGQDERLPEHVTPMLYQDIGEKDFAISLDEDENVVRITTGAVQVLVYRDPFRIEVRDGEGKPVAVSGSRTHNEFPVAFDAFPTGLIENRRPRRTYAVENFNLHPGERIYGLGEVFSSLNHVGKTISLWHIEGLGNTTGRRYKNVPFFLSSQGYGVFVNSHHPMTFWIGSREVTKVQVAVEEPFLDYYFFYGPTPGAIIERYTALTGRAAVPPRWSFGVWMSRLSYRSQEEVLELAHRLREEDYPCDVINIDVGWFEDEWACDWRFDPERFPDPAAMFERAAELGFKICLWQLPYVMDGLEIAKEARQQGALAKNRGPFFFGVTGSAHAIDFTKQAGVKWYQEQLRHLFELGARVIKVDFGEGIEPHQQFGGGELDGRAMHNLYPLLYNQAAFEATADFWGEGESLIWARSAYAGSQRYPVHWSGDNSANFHNLLPTLRAGMNLGLCGFTFWSQDTGGFVGIPDDKLMVRWSALTTFQSHFRFHGTPPKFREPWQFGKEAQVLIRGWIQLRYRFIPYIFSESIKATHVGLPLLRPLFLEFPDDPVSWTVEDQFMCGERLLVAPLLTREDSRSVYLPLGEWIHFFTRERFRGPGWFETGDVPLDQSPLYVRAGTLLPLGDVVPFISKARPQPLTLVPFPDVHESATYRLHDEEGWVEYQVESGTEVAAQAKPENRNLPPTHLGRD